MCESAERGENTEKKKRSPSWFFTVSPFSMFRLTQWKGQRVFEARLSTSSILFIAVGFCARKCCFVFFLVLLFSERIIPLLPWFSRSFCEFWCFTSPQLQKTCTAAVMLLKAAAVSAAGLLLQHCHKTGSCRTTTKIYKKNKKITVITWHCENMENYI